MELEPTCAYATVVPFRSAMLLLTVHPVTRARTIHDTSGTTTTQTELQATQQHVHTNASSHTIVVAHLLDGNKRQYQSCMEEHIVCEITTHLVCCRGRSDTLEWKISL